MRNSGQHYQMIMTQVDEINTSFRFENHQRTELVEKNEKYGNLKKWLIDNQAIFQDNIIFPIAFGHFGVVGCKTKREIKFNEAMLYIPHKFIIDSSRIKAAFSSEKLFEKIKQFENHNTLILTIFLIREGLTQCSFWKPYIDLISSDMPVFWDITMLKELEVPNLVDIIFALKEELEEYYNCLKISCVFNDEMISLNQFMTYYCFVQSRHFFISENQSILVPLADCLNHSHVRVKYEIFDSVNFVFKYATDFDENLFSKHLTKTECGTFYDYSQANDDLFLSNDENDNSSEEKIQIPSPPNQILSFSSSDYFCISTNSNQKFPPGVEAYNCYGKYSNEYLLTWYGFCYLDNKYDYTEVNIKLPKNEDRTFDKCIDVFFGRQLNTIEDQYFNVLSFKLKARKLCKKLINYFRFSYFYENETVEHYLKYKFDINAEIEIMSQVLEFLEKALVIKISNKHTIEDDLMLLKLIIDNKNRVSPHEFDEEKMKTSQRYANAIIFRLSQKLNILRQREMMKEIKSLFLFIIESNQCDCEKQLLMEIFLTQHPESKFKKEIIKYITSS